MTAAFPSRERGAALLAVLAMVALLAAFASLGLSRLRATTSLVGDAEARAIAGNVARSGTAAALELVAGWQAENRRAGGRRQTFRIDTGAGTAALRFENARNCFNLNGLGKAAGSSLQAAQSTPADFARLLTAAGIPPFEAGRLATATAARLQQTGALWADGSEWLQVEGVTAAHWALAGRLLCTLPNREAMAIDLNGLTAAEAPLLAGAGLDVAEARRVLAARPEGGWGSAGEFWRQASAGGVPQTATAQAAGTSSRWVLLDLTAHSGQTVLRRQLLLDTAERPARVARTLWRQPAANEGGRP